MLTNVKTLISLYYSLKTLKSNSTSARLFSQQKNSQEVSDSFLISVNSELI